MKDRLEKAEIKREEERSLILQVLYACEYNNESWKLLLKRISEIQETRITSFIEQVVELSQEHREEINTEITLKLENWDYKRVAVIDKIILHMALVELLYCEDIPPEVSMNEAIELAKKFSTEQSSRFINGLLDAVYKKLKQEGKITKSGRGLISRIMD
jgi:N utilization substance protein B